MMKRITAYITIQILFSVLTITVVLTGIAWLTQTLRYIELIASNAMPIFIFLKIALYLVPNFFVIVMPIAFLIGILFIYNKLENDHELIVMKSTGMSYWQMSTPVFISAFFITIFLYACTLYFVPLSFRKYAELSNQLQEHSLATLVSIGQFDTFGKHTVYTRSQDEQGNFLGILIYDSRFPHKRVTYMAEKGVVFKEKGKDGILLINGNRQEENKETQKTSILYFDQYIFKTNKKEGGTERRLPKTHERSFEELLHPNNILSPQMRLNFLSAAHQRLIAPLYTPAFGFLAVCFLILGPYNRRGRSKKILAACTIAALLEAIIMIALYNTAHLYVMLIFSYLCLFSIIITCLFLLSPLADKLWFYLFWKRRP